MVFPGTILADCSNPEATTIVPYSQGRFDFPGAINNRLTIPNLNTAADPALSWRCELQRQEITVSGVDSRPWRGDPFLSYTTVGRIVSQLVMTDATVSASPASTVPVAIGAWYQWRGDWDPVTDTISQLWRPVGTDLANDTGWTVLGSAVFAGKVAKSVGMINTFGDVGSLEAYGPGSVHRWVMKVNGAVVIDINEGNIVSDSASFVATSGQTVTVTRQNRLDYLTFPGTAGNGATTPDAAALDILGDMSMQIRARATDWTPAAVMPLISKHGSATQFSYIFRIDAGGFPRISWSAGGITALTAVSTAAVPAADGTWKWIGFTLDVDNGAAGNSVRFWTSNDDTAVAAALWTQLGTTVTQAGITSIFNSTAIMEVATHPLSFATHFAGDISEIRIYNAIGAAGVMSILTPVWLLDHRSSALTDVAATIAPSIGGTLTILRSGSPSTTIVRGPDLELVPTVNQVCAITLAQGRGCSPLGASANPITETTPFDPACNEPVVC